MPKGYAIFTEKVNDQEGMGIYVQAAVPTIFAAGGTIIVGGQRRTSSRANGTATRR